jgi:uncharacterized protein (DUF302 family)
MNRFLVLLIGVVVGVAAGLSVAWIVMPNMMLQVDRSRLTFDETVAAIQASALEDGWQVPKVYDLRQSLISSNEGDIGPTTVVSLCKPTHAFAILSDSDHKMVAGMMPCRIGVYEADGAVYVTRLNIGLMAEMFGGPAAEVMGKVAEEEHAILSDIVMQ